MHIPAERRRRCPCSRGPGSSRTAVSLAASDTARGSARRTRCTDRAVTRRSAGDVDEASWAQSRARPCRGERRARWRSCRPSSARRRRAAGCGRAARRGSSRHLRDRRAARGPRSYRGRGSGAAAGGARRRGPRRRCRERRRRPRTLRDRGWSRTKVPWRPHRAQRGPAAPARAQSLRAASPGPGGASDPSRAALSRSCRSAPPSRSPASFPSPGQCPSRSIPSVVSSRGGGAVTATAERSATDNDRLGGNFSATRVRFYFSLPRPPPARACRGLHLRAIALPVVALALATMSEHALRHGDHRRSRRARGRSPGRGGRAAGKRRRRTGSAGDRPLASATAGNSATAGDSCDNLLVERVHSRRPGARSCDSGPFSLVAVAAIVRRTPRRGQLRRHVGQLRFPRFSAPVYNFKHEWNRSCLAAIRSVHYLDAG